jgi:hypothetical protein
MAELMTMRPCETTRCRRRPAAAERRRPEPPAGRALGVGLLLVVIVLAAGCQRTLFSQAPAAVDGCNVALQGHWVSVRKDGSADGEIEASLGPDCIATVVEHRPDGPRVWPPVALASGRVGRRDLLWLDAATVNAAFEIETGPLDREGAVYVFAYELDGERLNLLQPDHRRLARRVVDRSLDGAVLINGHDITVRLDGDAQALSTLVGQRRSFQRKDPLRFRRGTLAVER